MNFESLLPRVNAIIKLDGYGYDNLSKNTRNKVKKGLRKGLVLEKATPDKLNIFYKFIKTKLIEMNIIIMIFIMFLVKLLMLI